MDNQTYILVIVEDEYGRTETIRRDVYDNWQKPIVKYLEIGRRMASRWTSAGWKIKGIILVDENPIFTSNNPIV